jgi:hypothetical protein
VTTPEPNRSDEPEEVDGLPVDDAAPTAGAELTPVEKVADVVLATPGRQAAVLAASGFVAGAASLALVHRRKARVTAKRLRKRNGRPALGEVVSSGSFLVDVHLLRRD